MNVIGIIQARLTSKRFPGKVLKKICNIPMLEILIKRISFSKKLDKIIVVIPNSKKNEKLKIFLEKKKITYYQGDEANVLQRYYFAAEKHAADIIVRITADNPLVDPEIIDKTINKIKKKNIDYIIYAYPYLPLGLGVEAFTIKALRKIYHNAKSKYHKEHVTTYISDNKKLFKTAEIKGNKVYSEYRLTVDRPLDLKVIKYVFNYFKPNIKFNFKKITKLFKENSEIFLINKKIVQKNLK